MPQLNNLPDETVVEKDDVFMNVRRLILWILGIWAVITGVFLMGSAVVAWRH